MIKKGFFMNKRKLVSSENLKPFGTSKKLTNCRAENF